MTPNNALLISGETAPSETELKRALLFFEMIQVPDLRDSAIINRGEVSEVFPNGRSVVWGEFAPYPRSFSFEDEFRQLQSNVRRVVGTGKLKFVDIRQPSPDDAVKSWIASVTGLKSEPLIRAALPDYAANQEPVNLKSGSGYNMVVVGLTDFPSRYLWLTKVDGKATLEISEEWRRMALARLGRVLKGIRHCSVAGTVPLFVRSAKPKHCSGTRRSSVRRHSSSGSSCASVNCTGRIGAGPVGCGPRTDELERSLSNSKRASPRNQEASSHVARCRPCGWSSAK